MAKTTWIILSILGVLLFGGIIYVVMSGTGQSTLADNRGINNAVFQETSSDEFSTTYHVTFTNPEPNNAKGACGASAVSPLDYSLTLLSTHPLPIGYTSATLDAKNGQVVGLKSEGTGQCELYPYTVINKTLTAKCKTGDSSYGFECVFNIQAYSKDSNGNIVPAIYYDFQGGEFDITLLKSGVQCTSSQLSLCSANQECISNVCTDKIVDTSNTEDSSATSENTTLEFVSDTGTTDIITQEEINLVQTQVDNGITEVTEIAQNTGFSEEKVKFILEETDNGITPLEWILIGLGIVIMIGIITFVIVLLKRK